MARRRQQIKPKQYELDIVKQDNHGEGIAYHNDKIIFVGGAMLGEKVLAKRKEKRAQYEKAYAIEIIKPSPKRIEPKCEAFVQCGGCSFQYMSIEEQRNTKQNWLKQTLEQQTGTQPTTWLPMLTSQDWGYRRKARLGVRFVIKKDKVLVGFRERAGRFITDMARCEVLHEAVGGKLVELQDCIGQLSIKAAVAQIEVAITDTQIVLVLRHLEPLSVQDRQILLDFGLVHQFIWYLQSGGLDTIIPLEQTADLYYEHQDHNIKMHFLPQHFTQVNFELNEKMVSLALNLLELSKEDNVIDLFCGLGNFTLAIACYAKQVVGIEGDKALVEFAKKNADLNGLDNVKFYQADLFEAVAGFEWCRNQTYNKALIDPARSGALEVIEHLPKFGVQRLVYVSCNPDTLARDSKRLLELGYHLQSAGIMDMFPHTKHVESIALFIKD